MPLTTRQSKGSSLRGSDAYNLIVGFNTLLQIVANIMIGSSNALAGPVLALGGTTTAVKTTNAAMYRVNFAQKVQAAADVWTVANSLGALGTLVGTLAIGQTAVFLFGLNAAGTASAYASTFASGTTVYPPGTALSSIPVLLPGPVLPALPQDVCIMGYCTVTATAATFLVGTDAWNKASVTFTFADGVPLQYVAQIADIGNNILNQYIG
jgi:hypothetical protein